MRAILINKRLFVFRALLAREILAHAPSWAHRCGRAFALAVAKDTDCGWRLGPCLLF